MDGLPVQIDNMIGSGQRESELSSPKISLLDRLFGGIRMSWWKVILFAIIIMTNCEKPLESAAKTFTFFS